MGVLMLFDVRLTCLKDAEAVVCWRLECGRCRAQKGQISGSGRKREEVEGEN